MVGFFLIGLGGCIPVLSVVFDISITSDKWFAAINSDNFDDLGPLIDGIALLVSFYDCRLDVIKVIDSVLHIEVLVHFYVLRIEHFFVMGHFIHKSYIIFFSNY